MAFKNSQDRNAQQIQQGRKPQYQIRQEAKAQAAKAAQEKAKPVSPSTNGTVQEDLREDDDADAAAHAATAEPTVMGWRKGNAGDQDKYNWKWIPTFVYEHPVNVINQNNEKLTGFLTVFRDRTYSKGFYLLILSAGGRNYGMHVDEHTLQRVMKKIAKTRTADTKDFWGTAESTHVEWLEDDSAERLEGE